MEFMITLLLALTQAATIPVTPEAFALAKEPQVAIDRDHRVYVAFGQEDAIYVSISADQGATFTSPVKVTEAGKLSLGMRRGPRIAAHNGTVTITATYGTRGGGQDGDLLAFRSTDQGQHWSAGVPVNDVAGAAREGLHGMAMAPDGTLACAWLDLRSKGTKLNAAVSKDGGATWSKNALAYASPSGTICQCCQPSVAFDSKGTLYCMFRNVIDGSRDMYLIRSTNMGETFTNAQKLGQGTWPLNACPMDGGSLVIRRDGLVETVWRRQESLYREVSNQPEQKVGDGSQGWLVEGDEGMVCTWNQGRMLMASTAVGRPMQLSANGQDSVVAASPDKKLVVAAWTENGIRLRRLSR
jgi:hypothetical protein